MISVTIDGIKVQVEPGTTILQAAEKAGVEIPTLCYIKDLFPEASCRMCMVEIQGMPKLVTACSFPAADGNGCRAAVRHHHRGRAAEHTGHVCTVPRGAGH